MTPTELAKQIYDQQAALAKQQRDEMAKAAAGARSPQEIEALAADMRSRFERRQQADATRLRQAFDAHEQANTETLRREFDARHEDDQLTPEGDEILFRGEEAQRLSRYRDWRTRAENTARTDAARLCEHFTTTIDDIAKHARRAIEAQAVAARSTAPAPPAAPVTPAWTPPSPNAGADGATVAPAARVAAPAELRPADLVGKWLLEITNPIGLQQLYEVDLSRSYVRGKQSFEAHSVAPPPWQATGTWSVLPGDQILLQGSQTWMAPFPQSDNYGETFKVMSISRDELEARNIAGWPVRGVRR